MTPDQKKSGLDYDAMIVGAGIAGMETAALLGDMGYKVLLVEKEPSIGGKSILLSKVFPTLDCASCIVTPKMAAVAHHPQITPMVYTEVDGFVRNEDGSFTVDLHKKASYVNFDACTGCDKCEEVCTVSLPDKYNYNLAASRAAHIPFPQAVPKKAIISRNGQAPCTYACPAGVKPSGFVSLARAGRYEEAFRMHLEDTPLVGSLARACYAPCESECTRAEKDGPLHIRAIKRFMADRYYANHPEPEYGRPQKLLDKKVAVVGSGPGGLNLAYHLARKGYQVKIFEAESEPGGLLRFGIPGYRLPKSVLDRDIKNVTALGVEIETEAPIDSLKDLKEQGFDAIFLATGSLERMRLGIPGEDLEGVMGCLNFLKEANRGQRMDLTGKTIVLIGGGNACMDPARMALRSKANKVIVVYRRSRAEMPAFPAEVAAAEEEGVELCFLTDPTKFIGENGKLKEVVCQKMRLGEPDASGRRRPVPINGSEFTIKADVAVVAIGNSPTTSVFKAELELNRDGTVKADPESLQTSLPYVFAGGDAVLGPSSMVEAMGQARRAAFHIDRLLQGLPLDVPFGNPLAAADKRETLDRTRHWKAAAPITLPERLPQARILDFEPYEFALSEDDARMEANRCLNCADCSQCMECVNICPADCIDFSMRPESLKLHVGSVVLATGFEIMNPTDKDRWGYGTLPDVITGPQMERLLSPTRPYNGVLRPSDGKEPESIAMVLCAGSRDETFCNPLCCRIGCMYALKQAQLIMGALPIADVTIYYIDIRAFGKGYEEFYEQAKGMGVSFVKGKVARIEPLENGRMALHYEDMLAKAGPQIREHDLVVLAVGFLPNTAPFALYKGSELERDAFNYLREVNPVIEPGATNVAGLYLAGTVNGAKDIPDTVLHSGATATQVSAYLERMRAD
ncbi:MAG TPA: FAD-dependent oxidoreductase [Anaerolineales bacterium]|nr:FAD-dependent oxidoreductase [Anaerolineales bacterium]